MRNIQLLDCTLRDGGYLNDWEFGHNNLISIYQRLVASGVEIIEVGFINGRRPFDRNRSIFPDTESIRKIYGDIKIKAPITVGMIDYGTCALENIEICADSWIDGIRVIFKKQLMNEAMEYCAKLMEKGYKVFSQLVAVSDYSDEELLTFSRLANKVKPYAVSMVDTYGLLYPKDMLHIFEILDFNIDKTIQIGFHAHNNLQLGFALCVEFLDRKTDRGIVVDGTLYGMGKSAGNDPLELVAMYLNNNYGKTYKISQILDAIEESIIDLFKKYSWGYKTFFYLSSKNHCHPTYVGFFQDKKNLSVGDIDEVLSRIEPDEKKLFFDRQLAEKLYEEYTKEKYDDSIFIAELERDFRNKKILLLGPGKNVILQKSLVNTFIANNNPICIAINYIPAFVGLDYVFVTNSNRYLKMASELLVREDVKIIATSNISSKRMKFDFCIDREPLLERDQTIIDNSFLMFLKVLRRAGITKVYCAGFDGYSDREDNFFDEKMEYQFLSKEAGNLNRHIRKVLRKMKSDINVEFLTYSHYLENEEET